MVSLYSPQAVAVLHQVRTFAFSFSFSSSPLAAWELELFLNMEKKASVDRGRDYSQQASRSAQCNSSE